MIRKYFSASAAIVLFAVFVFILSKVDITEIITQLKEIKIKYYIGAFFLYVLNNIIRSLRFKLLLKIPLNLNLICVTGMYNFITGLLPMGSGEISLPLLLKKYYPSLSNYRNVSVLILTRIQDYSIVLFLFLISLLYLKPFSINLFYLSVLVLFLILLLLPILFLSDLILLFEKIPFSFTRSFFTKLAMNIKDIKKKDIFRSLTLTLIIWLINSVITYVVFLSIDLNLIFMKALYFNTFNIATQILPINSVAGFGLKEVTFTIILMTLGFSKDIALQNSVTIHLLLLGNLIFWGIISYSILSAMNVQVFFKKNR